MPFRTIRSQPGEWAFSTIVDSSPTQQPSPAPGTPGVLLATAGGGGTYQLVMCRALPPFTWIRHGFQVGEQKHPQVAAKPQQLRDSSKPSPCQTLCSKMEHQQCKLPLPAER